SIRLSDRPFSIFPLWGLLNKTDTSAKNTGAAILCTTGGAIRGYEGALAGSVPISYDSTCIENLKTNTSPIIGTWTLVSASFSNPPAQVSFYPDGAGQAGGRGLTWSISGTVLTMTLNNGKTGTGALTWGTGNSTFTWKFTGTLVTGGGTVVMKRQ
ncbi:MAG: hypothetical protein P4L55_09585, partial [Syntrophobacteraceae bacterium]|nr:hypothetical protein [Syntrophobacteraceae bacterium]